MESIGIRELRQHASRYVHRVIAGESIMVTERGKPAVVMSPAPENATIYDELVASGELIPAERPFGEILLSDPLPGKPGFSASAELERMRAEERY